MLLFIIVTVNIDNPTEALKSQFLNCHNLQKKTFFLTVMVTMVVMIIYWVSGDFVCFLHREVNNLLAENFFFEW